MGFTRIANAAVRRAMRWSVVPIALALAPPVAAKGGVTPLFVDSAPLQVTISGPINAIARAADRSTEPQDATISVNGETHQIALSARGVSRRRTENCRFPPLSVLFKTKPAETSLFDGQKRIKLVTHCRAEARFDQYVLREYAAYRLYNQLTDESLRVRLAKVRYEDKGKIVAERPAFFIEDIDDAGRRLGLKKIEASDVPVSAFGSEDVARYMLFQYMISNLDWDMTHGPQLNDCCHNSKILGPTLESRTGLTPVPYDFDYSGLVDSPNAIPPVVIPVTKVTQRYYRGYCSHNEETRRAVAQFAAAQGKLSAELASIPDLDDRSRSAMDKFIADFFADTATADGVERRLIKACRKNS